MIYRYITSLNSLQRFLPQWKRTLCVKLSSWGQSRVLSLTAEKACSDLFEPKHPNELVFSLELVFAEILK
jgi:hypothetical protein